MKPKKKGPKAPSPFKEADLLSLELRVARHADRLWRSAGYRGGRDRIYWQQAESAVIAKHFAAHKIVKVRIKGHGHDRSLGRFVTNKHGNVTFRIKIPKSFKPGTYRLTVKIGSTVKTVIIRVRR